MAWGMRGRDKARGDTPPDDLLSALRAGHGPGREDAAVVLLARTGWLARSEFVAHAVAVSSSTAEPGARVDWGRVAAMVSAATHTAPGAETTAWTVLGMAERIATGSPVHEHEVVALPTSMAAHVWRALAAVRRWPGPSE